MIITAKETKETIQVLHNNREEMLQTVEKLKADGWSDNTKISMSGESLFKSSVSNEDIAFILQNYPDVKIHYPSKDDFLYNSPYVLITKHERVINREEI